MDTEILNTPKIANLDLEAVDTKYFNLDSVDNISCMLS